MVSLCHRLGGDDWVPGKAKTRQWRRQAAHTEPIAWSTSTDSAPPGLDGKKRCRVAIMGARTHGRTERARIKQGRLHAGTDLSKRSLEPLPRIAQNLQATDKVPLEMPSIMSSITLKEHGSVALS